MGRDTVITPPSSPSSANGGTPAAAVVYKESIGEEVPADLSPPRHRWFKGGGAAYIGKLVVALLLYWVTESVLPIYNKHVFDGTIVSGVHKFPYPVTTASLQLAVVGVLLVALDTLMHFTGCYFGGRGAGLQSWVFGPHFLYKLRCIAPCGVLYGFKYAISYWGLYLVPKTLTHYLLQSSEIVFICFFGRVVNKEKVHPVGYAAAFLCLAGNVMVAVDLDKANPDLSGWAIPVNLISPVLLAGVVSAIRWGVTELHRRDGPLGGTTTVIEFTAVKCVISAAVAVCLALAIENGHTWVQDKDKGREAWWDALNSMSGKAFAFIFVIEPVMSLVNKVGAVWLASLITVVAYGVAAAVKVVPQWTFAAWDEHKWDHTDLNIAGAALIFAASNFWAVHKYHKNKVAAAKGDSDEEEGGSVEAPGAAAEESSDERAALLRTSDEGSPAPGLSDSNSRTTGAKTPSVDCS